MAETAGETTFEQIGCTKCHVPSLPSTVGPLEAYTDLSDSQHGNGPG